MYNYATESLKLSVSGQQQVSEDQHSFPDKLKSAVSNKLSDTVSPNSQSGTNFELFEPVLTSDLYTSFPLNNDIPRINENDANVQIDHCYRVIKTESSIFDNQTPYGETCQETAMSSLSSKDVEPEVFNEISEHENTNRNSQQSETNVFANSADEDTEAVWGKMKRKRSPAVSKGTVGLRKSPKKKKASGNKTMNYRQKRKLPRSSKYTETPSKKSDGDKVEKTDEIMIKKGNKKDGRECEESLCSEECQQTFRRQIDYDNHRIGGKCKLECEFCGKVFDRKTLKSFRLHLDTHSSHRKGSDTNCQHCGKNFPNKANLERHKKSRHSDDNAFRCGQCFFNYSSESELYLHKLKKHNREEGKFPCPECPKVYSLAKTLQYHIQFIHLGNCLPCSICGRRCRKEDLRRHEATHRTSRDYKCDQCASDFKSKSELTLHKKRHTKSYTHYCETCGQGCFGVKELVTHRRIHTGEKPFACSLCDYRCAHKPNLKIHMRGVHDKSTQPQNTHNSTQ